MQKPNLLSPDQVDVVLKKDLANILARAKEGKPLTAAQRITLSSYARDEDDVELPPPYVTSKVNLVRALGISRPCLDKYLKAVDSPGRDASGRFDVAAWLAYLRTKGVIESDGYDEKHALEVARLRIRLRMDELALLESERALIPIEEHISELCSYAQLVNQVLDAWTLECAALTKDAKLASEAEALRDKTRKRLEEAIHAAS